jgi:3alpha(or 20beta)-hydroxysteroid dehydrogenase
MVATAIEWTGGLDVLVNNAGGMDVMNLRDSTSDRVRALLETAVVGTTLLIKTAATARCAPATARS